MARGIVRVGCLVQHAGTARYGRVCCVRKLGGVKRCLVEWIDSGARTWVSSRSLVFQARASAFWV